MLSWDGLRTIPYRPHRPGRPSGPSDSGRAFVVFSSQSPTVLQRSPCWEDHSWERSVVLLVLLPWTRSNRACGPLRRRGNPLDGSRSRRMFCSLPCPPLLSLLLHDGRRSHRGSDRFAWSSCLGETWFAIVPSVSKKAGENNNGGVPTCQISRWGDNHLVGFAGRSDISHTLFKDPSIIAWLLPIASVIVSQ